MNKLTDEIIREIADKIAKKQSTSPGSKDRKYSNLLTQENYKTPMQELMLNNLRKNSATSHRPRTAQRRRVEAFARQQSQKDMSPMKPGMESEKSLKLTEQVSMEQQQH